MEYSIAANLLKFRKKAGLSQLELGKALGVSPQAVSRWEQGGMPDASLIPDIARVLHCTLDELYGITSAEDRDIRVLLKEDIMHRPAKQRAAYIDELAWYMIKLLSAGEVNRPETAFTVLGACEEVEQVEGEKDKITNVAIIASGGLFHACRAVDFKYTLLMPEPKGGYTSVLKPCEVYRELFSLLSRPNRLEVLLLSMYLPTEKLFTLEYICSELGLSKEEALESTEDLCSKAMLIKSSIQTTDHNIEVYNSTCGSLKLAFLCLAYTLSLSQEQTMQGKHRKEPLLRGEPSDWSRGKATSGTK